MTASEELLVFGHLIWRVSREFNHRTKPAFEKARVEISCPNMRLVLPEGPVDLNKEACT